MTTEKNILVAKCIGAYGVKGWLRVAPLGSGDALQHAKTWRVQPRSGGERLLEVEGIRAYRDAFVVKFLGIDSKEDADLLKGGVYLARSDFPEIEEGSYWAVDLVGCSVMNRDGFDLGQVLGFESNGAQQILCIGRDDIEYRIPLVKSYVDKIDTSERSIVVDWQSDWK